MVSACRKLSFYYIQTNPQNKTTNTVVLEHSSARTQCKSLTRAQLKKGHAAGYIIRKHTERSYFSTIIAATWIYLLLGHRTIRTSWIYLLQGHICPRVQRKRRPVPAVFVGLVGRTPECHEPAAHLGRLTRYVEILTLWRQELWDGKSRCTGNEKLCGNLSIKF